MPGVSSKAHPSDGSLTTTSVWAPTRSDGVLEQLTKMTVAEIFEAEGEDAFRDVETQVPNTFTPVHASGSACTHKTGAWE